MPTLWTSMEMETLTWRWEPSALLRAEAKFGFSSSTAMAHSSRPPCRSPTATGVLMASGREWYLKAWRDQRRRRFIMWSLGLLFLPAMLLVFRLVPSGNEQLLLTFARPWLAAFGISIFYLGFFRCPRCSKFFFVDWWKGSNPFARICLHCGLRKGWNPE